MKLLIFLFCAIVLSSCGKFDDGAGSIWQAGLWIIPWITGLGCAWFSYLTYQQSKGSVKIKEGRVTDEDAGKQSLYELPFFWIAAGLFIATVVIIIMVNSDK